MDIYADKSSLVLRELLANPEQAWVVDDLAKHLGISRALVGQVTLALRQKGYLKGVARGRNASFSVRHLDEIVTSWTRAYSFEKNKTETLFSPDPNILTKFKRYMKDSSFDYALTLHAGANLMTQFVNDPNIYAYFPANQFEKYCKNLRKDLSLLKLEKGGNIVLTRPFYKHSIFYGLQKIKGFSVVSNLQLYLDLFSFPQRGYEHAQYLERILSEKGKPIVQKLP